MPPIAVFAFGVMVVLCWFTSCLSLRLFLRRGIERATPRQCVIYGCATVFSVLIGVVAILILTLAAIK